MGNQSGPVWRREFSGPQCREDVLTYARIVDEICDLAQLLESVNLSAWAIRLVDAVDGASTGGEIMMAVRWDLQELMRVEKQLPDKIRLTCQRLVREIGTTGV
jgi:hypothetical protein